MIKAKRTEKPTRERLLEAAECLFAKQGLRATTLREITELAEVNIAAVNYHFRSKDALVRAVYERNFEPLNQERLRLLDRAIEAAGAGPLSIESVLHAIFGPMLDVWRRNPNFILIVGRLKQEPDEELSEFIGGLYRGGVRRFTEAALRALPGANEDEVVFWMYFLLGGVVYTLLSSQDLERFYGRNILNAPDSFLERLIAFGSAGLLEAKGRCAGVEPAVMK